MAGMPIPMNLNNENETSFSTSITTTHSPPHSPTGAMRENPKSKKKEKKRNKKEYGEELRQAKDKDKKRTKKKKEKTMRQEKTRSRGLTDSIIRSVRETEEEKKTTGTFIAPLQPLSLPTLADSSPRFSSSAPILKPPVVFCSSSDSDEEELEDICKRCEIEPKVESSSEPLRCPAPTPLAMWSGELRTRPPARQKPQSLRLTMEELRMTSVLTRSISMPTLLRKPIAVAALKSLKQSQEGQSQVVPRLNLANVYLMESFASQLERLHVNNGPVSDRPPTTFMVTPRSAFTETPRAPQTAHI